MKRKICILLVMVLVFGTCAGCGKKDEKVDNPVDQTESVETMKSDEEATEKSSSETDIENKTESQDNAIASNDTTETTKESSSSKKSTTEKNSSTTTEEKKQTDKSSGTNSTSSKENTTTSSENKKESEKHKHSYSKSKTNPTCTEQGYTTYSCTCGDSYKGDYVSAKGHTEVIDKAVAATPTTTGLTEGKHCAVCGQVLIAQQVVPKDTSSLVNNTTFTLTNDLSQEYSYISSSLKLYTKCKIDNIRYDVSHAYGENIKLNIVLQMKKTYQGDVSIKNIKFNYTLYRDGVGVKTGQVLVNNTELNTLYEENISYTGLPGNYTMTCKSVIY